MFEQVPVRRAFSNLFPDRRDISAPGWGDHDGKNDTPAVGGQSRKVHSDNLLENYSHSSHIDS
jgi:hypothetical protein